MQNKRVSKGRQRVAMVKMSNDSNLQVTFSKRRSGLFKKASELCTLCGAEIVVIVFSPGKKVFSFGHPSVDGLIDRYFTRNPPPLTNTGTMQLIEAHRNASVRELNVQLTQATNQLEIEKKRSEELNEMRKARQVQCWWENPIEELDMSQLQQLKSALDELKRNVAKQADIFLLQNSNPANFYAGNLNVGHPTMPNGMPPLPYTMVMKKSQLPISQGRQKIEMAKITKKSNLQVTFSKRRSGLFKKASEICTLCGVENIAIIVFSPANKPFCFGHPEVESTIDRFLISQNTNTTTNFGKLLYEAACGSRDDKNNNIHELNKQFSDLVNQLEAEKKRGEELDNLRKAGMNLCWWEAPIDELNLPQLQQLKTYLEELKNNILLLKMKIIYEFVYHSFASVC
uniref:MADS71 n=1 Tax=Hippophae rhamnoides TaxID=193516 RepID=A0AAU7LJM1_9ROSA